MKKNNGVTKLTETTGTVNGVQNIINFIEKCNKKYSEVIQVNGAKRFDFCQYTILTNNKIKLFF